MHLLIIGKERAVGRGFSINIITCFVAFPIVVGGNFNPLVLRVAPSIVEEIANV
jgi:hypothetical protein